MRRTRSALITVTGAWADNSRARRLFPAPGRPHSTMSAGGDASGVGGTGVAKISAAAKVAATAVLSQMP